MERSLKTRGKRRPRKTIVEVIKKDLKINNLDRSMIHDRTLWRKLIYVADPLNGIRLGCCCCYCSTMHYLFSTMCCQIMVIALWRSEVNLNKPQFLTTLVGTDKFIGKSGCPSLY